ncbi:Type I phosphodiesterase / nucleotide pyrophosphatase [Mucilaginibacter pineti]|uniref:Type I phosphodiesterase / nucleotide pyrophosphatase n=1 Tax=Mucilaginibacter pineti TaxID=1391627 RepID=A0A1G6ZQ43_9SPHI|nr:alkaline phosphatase family protein [Mucilaginibacter pineti]SDE04337.1 Type I phosphodiesterase / nucleotide pyrophosphatase [Mucilaginibacter pineti]
MRLINTVFFVLISMAAIAQPKPKVVIVIADGIPADVMERLHPPAMQQIIKEGAYTRAYVGGNIGTYTQTPTISAPGYNDMLTGTWAYKHNVWDNDNQHPNYNYPTIFRLFKTARPTGTTAIFSTWIENRKTLLGAGLPETKKLTIDYVYDGFEKDSTRFPHDTASLYLHQIDEHVVHAADSVIRIKAPDLSWIYLEYTDDVGHSKGTGKEFDKAIGLLDEQMKKIAAAIHFREANYHEKWLLVITTDHGRDSLTGAEHGDQNTRERTTWMILNHPVTNGYFKISQPAIVDILPSVANYLNISLPVSVKRELDGVPFTGPVSLSNARLNATAQAFTLKWKTFAPAEKLKIYITYTNHAKEGKKDIYKLIGTPSASAEKFHYHSADLLHHPFYKIVIEGKNNTLNVWHVVKAATAVK